MKEELQTALADLIQKTLQGVDTTTEFLTAEIPDVIRQLLMWHGIYNFIYFGLSLIFLVVSLYLFKGIFGNKRKVVWEKVVWEGDVLTEEIFCEIIRGCIGGVLVLIGLYKLNFTWLQIWIAPKVWLIEYMGQLVK